MSYAWVFCIVMAYMTAWFVYAQIKRRNDVADTAWGLGFVAVAWSSTVLATSDITTTAWLVNILVTIWGARLAIHIYTRNRKKPEDKRYKQLVAEGGTLRWLRSYLKVFVLQGLLLWIIALPIQAVHIDGGGETIGWMARLGLLLWVVGFYFETRGDLELRKFLAKKKRPKVLDTGLWRYTRHPNYFGEVTLWWGVFFLAQAVGTPVWTAVGPLTITYLILYVSGIPMLERRYADDKDYQRYVAKTSKFIPLPPRR